jgi:hypothetical protein
MSQFSGVDQTKSSESDLGYLLGTFIGSAVFLIPSFVLFFIAKKLKRKIAIAARDHLINSFDSI